MKRFAIIDLGTNTFKILIIEFYKNQTQTLYKTKIPVSLSEGANLGRLTVAGFLRGINALKAFKTNIIENYKVDKTIALATAGLRSTDNGKEFVDFVQRELGIQIEIISGEKEAELIYKGIKMAVPMTEENVLMMDIGGGSTEFIIGNKHEIKWRGSYKLGAGRLMEKFKPSDPIKPSEIENFEAYFKDKLEEVMKKAQKYEVKKLIGSSGSWNTFARMAAARYSDSSKYKEKLYFEIHPSQFKEMHADIIRSTKDERSTFEGIKLIRSEIILASSLLVNFVVRKLNIQQIIQSQYSMVEGVITLLKNTDEL